MTIAVYMSEVRIRFDQKRRKELFNAQIVADCQKAIICADVE